MSKQWKIILLNFCEFQPEVIRFYNYTCEVHSVTTRDGYILELHRIPNKGKQAVVLGHGIVGSSGNFVISGPGNALSFLLFDRGYDVWMINFRGNRYSRKHVGINPDKNPIFWQFSMHELGIYDLPAVIDYVLEETELKKVSYVCHSMGCAGFFVLLSEHPEYNDKVTTTVALGPVTHFRHTKSVTVKTLLQNVDLVETLTALGLQQEIMPSSDSYRHMPTLLMDSAFNDFAGEDPRLYENGFREVIYGHNPSGASLKEFLHYAHIFYNYDFVKYDYGPLNNLIRYRSLRPPPYNLTNCKVPVYIFYTQNDNIADMEDVERLANKLTTVVELNEVKDPLYSHMSLLMSKTAKELINDHIIDIIDRNKG